MADTDRIQPSTYFGLLAEFGSAEIPLATIAVRFFGMTPDEARRRAAMNRLPVPAYRVGSQKAPWLVSAADLAEAIDRQRKVAKEEWERSGTG